MTSPKWDSLSFFQDSPRKTAPATTSEKDIFSTVTDMGMILHDQKITLSSSFTDCFACDIARLLMNAVDAAPSLPEGPLPEAFYEGVTDIAGGEGFLDETGGDRELFCIHLKQMIHILRACGLVYCSDGRTSVSDSDLSGRALYFRLLDSFWNAVSWQDIFPSDEDAALALYEERSIMQDLLLRKREQVTVDDLTNEFFELTGFSDENNLMLISFIDFYLYTWLKHFNILKYRKSTGRAPVTLSLSDEGRKLLAACNN